MNGSCHYVTWFFYTTDAKYIAWLLNAVNTRLCGEYYVSEILGLRENGAHSVFFFLWLLGGESAYYIGANTILR